MDLTIKHLGDGQSIIRSDKTKRYLLLPIEEKAGDAQFYLISDNDVVQTFSIRLAIDHVDYFVPLDISFYDIKKLSFNIRSVPDSAVCWKEIKLSDEFDKTNREQYRPLYHFSPEYGWMNDPNGMVYKDGEYHLFYQYNPYASIWGNMHWGHAVSKDLIHWEHLPVALAPDGLGTIFSGSCVIDKDNTAGFGAGAMIAFYTSAGERQTQSMAYSLDNGRTFKKYSRNPVLTSTVRDFRDPKVFWHAETGKWIMVLAAGQEIQIYSSSDLKHWEMESAFGEGQGAHGGTWECPDLVQLPVKGTELKKWVMICNLSPGGPSGGSATQYFVGEFDGKKFINESAPEVIKWMDWGKDHYATVTWSNAPENRKIALAWMSNWTYANSVPTYQFRSSNSIPRELYLYTWKGETYMASVPVGEVESLRGKAVKKKAFKVDHTYNIESLFSGNNGAYEIEMTVKNVNAKEIVMQLYNSKGDEVDFSYNLETEIFSIDRTKSGNVDFGGGFSAVTIAPIEKQDEYKLRLLVDKASIEAFDGDGKFVMTNLVFPQEPYNSMSFYSKGGKFNVTSLTIYKLGK
ncbi:MAG: GH32 C-terminal domain-containing protein [Bacteroidales bacterium]|nr:GH32 C-terminal domain-containing protein [Bacteroidales bacterium]